MLLRFLLLLSCFVLFSSSLIGREHERWDSLAALVAREGVSPSTLLIFDLDETLIRYPGDLGSTAWFEEEWERASSQSAPAMAYFHQLAAFLAEHLPVVPVEAELPERIQQLQEEGITLMGITSRELFHPALADWPRKTIEQVEAAGFDLSRTAPLLATEEEGIPLYQSGILFCGKKGKGEVLRQFLEKIGKEATCDIWLIDDRESELEAVLPLLPDIRLVWYGGREVREESYSRFHADQELLSLIGDP